MKVRLIDKKDMRSMEWRVDAVQFKYEVLYDYTQPDKPREIAWWSNDKQQWIASASGDEFPLLQMW